MSINWNAPLFVAGTDRPATIVRPMQSLIDRMLGLPPHKWAIRADWNGDGKESTIFYDSRQINQRHKVTNAPVASPPPPAADPRSAEADEIYALFHEAFTSAGMAAKARAGELRDAEAWRMALFMLNRANS